VLRGCLRWGPSAPRWRTSKWLAGLALPLTIGLFGHQEAMARPTVPPVNWVGQCVFVSPGLAAHYNPSLSSLAGDGRCFGDPVRSTITLNLSGGAGLTCVGGLENMSGTASWSPPIPATQASLFVRATGAGPTLHLVMTGTDFTAVADLTADTSWALGCATTGTISPHMSGTMTFESG
jgi:hypothetical protein